jgi:hypothetical protein
MELSTSLLVRVSSGASRTELVGRHGDGWKVRVSAPPERGRANDAVLTLLSERLDVPRRSLEIVSGHGGRDKVIRTADISQAEAERRLEGAVR